MKYKRLLLMVFAIGFSTTSNAAVSRIEELGCENWLVARANNLSEQLENKLNSYLNLLANRYEQTKYYNFMDNVNPKNNEFWIDKYCRNNPSKNIMDGAKELQLLLIK